MAQAGESSLGPIFIYDNYVTFLEDWMGNAKENGITQKQFIEKTGIKSKAFLSDILARRKVMGKASVEPFIGAMGLAGDEAEYFRLLVKRDTTKQHEERTGIFSQLMDLRKRNVTSILAEDHMEYFSSWKYTVIREYILAKGLIKSAKEISRGLVTFKLGKTDVEKALKKLEQWGLIAWDDKAAGYRTTKFEILAYKNPPHIMLNDIKREMIETSIHAMEMLPKEQRNVTMSVRGLSKKNYQEMCEKINELRKEYLSLKDNDGDSDQVVALNIQMFPVAKITGDGQEGEES